MDIPPPVCDAEHSAPSSSNPFVAKQFRRLFLTDRGLLHGVCRAAFDALMAPASDTLAALSTPEAKTGTHSEP